jgi:hypothetical protein
LKPPPAAHLDPSLLVIAAGVAAALHVGKLPPAIGALREALLAGPPWIATLGWASWWWLLAGISALAALAVGRLVRADPGPRPGASSAASPLRARLALTLSTPGPWAVALAFAMYSAQWLAVIGFLPALAAVNIVGNVGAGRLLHRGVPAPALLATGFSAMALATLAAFAGAGDGGLPLAARYGALLAFSALGGLIPATLFSLAVRVAPGESTVATTVGWMQQWSSLGQLGGPPLVAAVASLAGGWHLTWTATGALSLAGLALAAWLGRLAAAPAPPGRPG